MAQVRDIHRLSGCLNRAMFVLQVIMYDICAAKREQCLLLSVSLQRLQRIRTLKQLPFLYYAISHFDP